MTAAIEDTSHVDKEQDEGLAFTKIVFFEVYPIEPSLVDAVHPTRRNPAVSDHSCKFTCGVIECNPVADCTQPSSQSP